VTPDVGGGFGAKGAVYPEDISWMVCAEARPSGALDRDAFGEHARIGSRRAQVQHVDRRDARGCRTAYRIEVLQDTARTPVLVRCFRS